MLHVLFNYWVSPLPVLLLSVITMFSLPVLLLSVITMFSLPVLLLNIQCLDSPDN